MKRNPYVYRIKSRDGHFYYGCRFAVGCHPDDFWRTYFTSSKSVRTLIDEHGEDYFDTKVVFRCDTPEDALRLEGELIAATHKMPGCLNQFLCRRDGTPVHLGIYGGHSEETKAKISAANKGLVRTPEQRAKLSEVMTGTSWTPAHYTKLEERLKDPAYQLLISEVQKGKKRTPEEKAHLSKMLSGVPKPEGFGASVGAKLVEYNASIPIYLRPRALGCHDAWAKAHEFYILWSTQGWGHERFCNRMNDGKNVRVFYNMYLEFKSGWIPSNDPAWVSHFSV